MTSLFSLAGRRALITGSSQGIGFALARGLSTAGAELVLNGRDAAKLAAAAETLRAEGATVRELSFDATDHEAARAAAPGWDIYALEADWRAYWARSGRPRLRSADKAFLGFVTARMGPGDR